MGVKVTLTGPLFDGRAEKILDAAIDRAEEDVALVGAALVRAQVARSARHSTGRFASHTVADRLGTGGFRAHTPGLRYVSWLEGTSTRNTRSSFHGYHPYREAAEEARARMPAIAGAAIGRGIKEING